MSFFKKKLNTPPVSSPSLAVRPGISNHVNNKKKASHFDFVRKIFNSVSSQEKINFARHLSVSIKTGMPLIQGLGLVKEQSSKRFANIIEIIIKDVNNGQFLAQSLERFGYIFGDFFINLVRVGETSGNLSSSLMYLARELKKQREIGQKVRGAMIYPIIILIATLGITLFLTLVIFPKILPIFTSLQIELPITTKIVISVLNFIKAYGLWAVGGLFVFGIFLRVLLTFQAINFIYHRILLLIPFVSKVVTNVTLTNFSRSLSVLLKSGMTLLDGLEVAKGTFTNLAYRKEVERVAEDVRKGESMARSLSSSKKFFPPMLVGMVQVGETTGNLEENLEYLAEYYESEVEETVSKLTTVLEPLLLLTMGVLVGFIALSIITPIYKITQGLKVK